MDRLSVVLRNCVFTHCILNDGYVCFPQEDKRYFPRRVAIDTLNTFYKRIKNFESIEAIGFSLLSANEMQISMANTDVLFTNINILRYQCFINRLNQGAATGIGIYVEKIHA